MVLHGGSHQLTINRQIITNCIVSERKRNQLLSQTAMDGGGGGGFGMAALDLRAKEGLSAEVLLKLRRSQMPGVSLVEKSICRGKE